MAVNPVTFRRNHAAQLAANFVPGELSPAVWGDCPIGDILDGTTPGYFWRWDANAMKTATNVNAAVAYWSGGLFLFGSDGAAVAAADTQGGGRTFSSDGDNEGVNWYLSGLPFQITRGKGKLWWEIEFSTSTVADTKHGLLTGLIDSQAFSATVPITAAGAIADVNMVGFRRDEADGDQIDTVYKANGVTAVTVQADALQTALVADTRCRLAMKYEPENDTFGNYILSFFQNNLRMSSYKQIPSAAGTDFPNDVRLTPFFALLNATGTTPGTTTVYQMQCAQLF